MIYYTAKKYIFNFITLLLLLKYIYNVKAENQCTSNLDCAKFNTEVDTHVCIRWDGQTDFVCYLSTEAYCDTDATCQSYNESLKFCYVPPWISNKNSQKQCFTVHEENGTCLEDIHCAKGLVCTNNVCVSGSTNSKVEGANTNSDTKTDTTNKTPVGNTNSKNKTNSTDTSDSKTSSSTYLDFDDEENKKKPVEIIGLPLWAFITIITVPIIFGIIILWGLSIGRKSYADEEEKKRTRLVIKNNEKDLEMNYKGSSEEKLLPQSTSDLSLKEDMMKSYINSSKGVGMSSSASSNSTFANNNLSTTAGVERTLNTKSSQASIEAKKLRKNKKSNTNLAAAAAGVPAKPKKPKSIVNSEYSDTNSQKGLINSVTMSAADSGVYSSYFGGGGAGSTVSSSYFNQPITVPTDPMNNYYYQQMLAAQQQQQLQAQTLMNQYYIDGTMGMPTVDMMQYQQLYGNMGMNNQMLYTQGVDLNAGTASTTGGKKKHKQKK